MMMGLTLELLELRNVNGSVPVRVHGEPGARTITENMELKPIWNYFISYESRTANKKMKFRSGPVDLLRSK